MATVSRQVFGQALLDAISPTVKPSCITAKVKVRAVSMIGAWESIWTSHPGQTPQTSTVTDPSAGSQLINVAYTAQNDPETTDSDTDRTFNIQMSLVPNYTCQVGVVGTTLTVVQRLWTSTCIRWNSTVGEFNPYDTIVTDVYDVSVGQGAGVQLVRDPTKQTVANNAQPAPQDLVNHCEGVRNMDKEMSEQFVSPAALDLSPVVASLPPNSIPADVTFSSATFDCSQNLVCS